MVQLWHYWEIACSISINKKSFSLTYLNWGDEVIKRASPIIQCSMVFPRSLRKLYPKQVTCKGIWAEVVGRIVFLNCKYLYLSCYLGKPVPRRRWTPTSTQWADFNTWKCCHAPDTPTTYLTEQLAYLLGCIPCHIYF